MITSQQRHQRSSRVPTTPSTGATGGPAQAVSLGAARVAAAITQPGATRGRDEWLAVVAHCQWLINTVTAVQDAALAEAARRESVWCEDGTLGESVHAAGCITLDAADLAAPLIGATHAQAQRRLELAVRLAANRAPVPAEQRDRPEPSGLTGLHTAMAQGRLDGYRAGVVAFELELAPADVADAVVAALAPRPGDDSTTLRQRTRRLIGRISPDLLRQRAERARAETGLRRWVAEPGVDEWHGTFPSEDAATAWAAIDRLAHDLVANGTCTTIEQARGKALTDLVTGNATIDVQIVLTVPADTQPMSEACDVTAAEGAAHRTHPQPHAAPYDGGPATNLGQSPSTPVEANPIHLEAAAAASDDELVASNHPPEPAGPDRGSADAQARTAARDDNIVGDIHQPASAGPDRGCADAEATTVLRDEILAGIQRSVSGETFIGAPSARPTATTGNDAGIEGGRARADAAAGGVPAHAPPVAAERDDDLIEVQGSRPSEPLLVRRSWLRDHLHKRPPQPRRGRPKTAPAVVACDPLTGARLDPNDTLATGTYRPSTELTALVKARDGRCRFPGCAVAARFCDLDHVRPWPAGPTNDTNLLTLCRRHHRIKQAPGWRLRLAPDGTATFTDPTGRTRTTTALDALHTPVLAADPADPTDVGLVATPADPDHPATPVAHGREPLPATAIPTQGPPAAPATGSRWSALEHHLTFRLEHQVHPMNLILGTPPTHRRCTSAAQLRAGHARTTPRAPWPDEPPF